MANHITKMTDSAKLLRSHLSATVGEKPAPVVDSFAQLIGKQLEAKGIAQVPGLPQEPQPQWFDKFIEHGQRHDEYLRKREAERQAELEAESAPKTAAEIIHRLLMADPSVQPSPHSGESVPALNSDELLRYVDSEIHRGRNE